MNRAFVGNGAKCLEPVRGISIHCRSSRTWNRRSARR